MLLLVAQSFLVIVLVRARLTGAANASLAELCKVDSLRNVLPTNGTLLGINFLPESLTAQVTNTSVGSGTAAGPSVSVASDTYSYCNLTVHYVHAGTEDRTIRLRFALPAPSEYKSRFYVGGGGGYSLSSDATGGLAYGAASGATDAGYDAFDKSLDQVVLLANGTLDWDSVRMFSHQALGEMTLIAKQILPSLYGSDTDSSKVWTYFSGCSDGGRQAMSQVQRWGDLYDGVVAGAPAFRQGQQQILHLYPAAIEQQRGYFPPPCALQKIVNATIEACDPLDGRTDGVISRTDLCMSRFDLNSTVGKAYYCAAETSTSLGFGFGRRQLAAGSQTDSLPEQNGTVTVNDVMIARAVYEGVFTSSGKRAYLSWQVGSDLGDAEPTYDNATSSWVLNIPSTGGVFVRKFLERLELDNLDDEAFVNITNDQLVAWMDKGTREYYDTLQTTWPDLSTFANHGGKLIHYHGESDNSVPAASSVHYRQSVASSMHADLDSSQQEERLDEWYRLFLVPGGAHCSANSLQPNGPFPQAASLMQQIIDWVERDIAPAGLNATVTQGGSDEGKSVSLCRWPYRPVWSSENATDINAMGCEMPDTEARKSWTYAFEAFGYAVY